MTVAVIVFAIAATIGIVYAVVHALTTRGPFIQHHFDDGAHQFESGKLGIWLFLGQEILFFSALFVAYIIYRHNHPEVFAYAHLYLDVNMGALNTAVLILSSLSAAWAVRAAQLGQQRLLIALLSVTLLCAFGFLIVKYFEYSHKVHVGTVFGKRFIPHETPDGKHIPQPDKTPGKTADGKPAPAEPTTVTGGPKAQQPAGAKTGAPAPGTQPVVPDDPSAKKEEPASHAAGGTGVLPALEAQKAGRGPHRHPRRGHAPAQHGHVLHHLLRDDRAARHPRAGGHLRLHLAAHPRHARALRPGLLRTDRLRGALLAPGRSHLDLPVPPALPDSLRFVVAHSTEHSDPHSHGHEGEHGHGDAHGSTAMVMVMG